MPLEVVSMDDWTNCLNLLKEGNLWNEERVDEGEEDP